MYDNIVLIATHIIIFRFLCDQMRQYLREMIMLKESIFYTEKQSM